MPNCNDAGARRVLLLTQDLDVWGAQRQLVELAKGLDRTRYDVRVGTLEPGGPLTAELVAHGIPVIAFPRRWRWDLRPIQQLNQYLRQHSIDIIHSFMFLPNFYARFAGKLARTPAVVSSLRSSGVRIEGWHRLAIDVGTCGLCDALIANSAAGAEQYVRYGGLRSRVTVVRNGLCPRPAPSPAALQKAATAWGVTRFEQRIGMVAALEPRKHQALLIDAMRTVVRQFPHAGLLLAGDGSQRPHLEHLVQSLGLGASVVFVGTIQPDCLYPLLDVYVQASAFGEGVSNSILEAMAHGLPVVATDVGGNREVVIEGRTGHIVPPGNDSALAAALCTLLADPARRQDMGEAGRQRVRSEFDIATMVAGTGAVYDSLLQPGSRRTNAPAAVVVHARQKAEQRGRTANSTEAERRTPC